MLYKPLWVRILLGMVGGYGQAQSDIPRGWGASMVGLSKNLRKIIDVQTSVTMKNVSPEFLFKEKVSFLKYNVSSEFLI